MREFKIIMMNQKGELVTEYEMFPSLDKALDWGMAQNVKREGAVVDIELMDCNEELKYEY